MIDKLFSAKVKITDTNRMLLEYCKQWVKTWCFELETKEEYDTKELFKQVSHLVLPDL
jgi:hypothetical protein